MVVVQRVASGDSIGSVGAVKLGAMSYTHVVQPGSKVDLGRIDSSFDSGLDKESAATQLEELGKELESLQELLYAAGQNGLLIVVQGRDTAGKDGSIKRLLEYTNVQSCTVAAFKVPTPIELAHDFLWRVHSKVPAKGAVTIFNRSHYEDVLVVRVHDLVPKPVWAARYDTINGFEKLLADSGCIVLKFMLHISKEEQEQRLLAREQDVEKSWKLAVRDWKERELWDDYTRAYEDALEKCSTKEAPWHIVSADKKWFRDLAMIEAVVKALRPYKDQWLGKLEEIGVQAKAELAEYRSSVR